MKPETIRTVVKPMVKAILEKATEYTWSLQGLGMFRLYLTDELRLHVWNDSFIVPGASPIHDHPWDFESIVVAGKVRQRRYWELSKLIIPRALLKPVQAFNCTTIECGEKAHVIGKIEQVNLTYRDEEFPAHTIYKQAKDEIHWSHPDPGTVTLCKRTFSGDRDHARVFWESGEFVSAAPRPATFSEVSYMAEFSLERYFS